MKQNVENNRLIALFMGWEETVHHNRLTMPGTTSVDVAVLELNYQSSWEKLMPVVEKISKYKYDGTVDCHAYPRTFGMIDDLGMFMVRLNRCTLFHAETLIEATYAAVIDFINWYNQQEKLQCAS